MAAQDPVSKFLESVRAGYGEKFGPVFDGFGLELVEDLQEAPESELKEMEDRLAAAGAGPAHIRRIRQAIDALRGQDSAGSAPPSAPAESPPPGISGPPAPSMQMPCLVPVPAQRPEELRAEPAPARNPFDDDDDDDQPQRSAPAAPAASDEWQVATSTADGMTSYVNVRTGEVRWEAPVRVEKIETPVANPYDSRVDEALPLPTSSAVGSDPTRPQDASMREWAKSAWKATQDGPTAGGGGAIRRTSTLTAGGSAEQKWSPSELEVYGKAYREVGNNPSKASAFLDRSGLPGRALTEIKRMGCLDVRTLVGPQDFYACCRLVAHCQALQYEDNGFDVLREAGSDLLGRLREMLGTPPRQMPHFQEEEKHM